MEVQIRLIDTLVCNVDYRGINCNDKEKRICSIVCLGSFRGKQYKLKYISRSLCLFYDSVHLNRGIDAVVPGHELRCGGS